MIKHNFNSDWEFTFDLNLDHFNLFGFDKYSDATGGAVKILDYSNWEKIDLPHDWAVKLPKDPNANVFGGARPTTEYNRAMSEEHSKIERIYSVGWYRKQFELDESMAGKRIFIEFEGIFRDAALWVNGEYMTRHTSGYTGFIIEITDHLLMGQKNSVAVRVDSSQPEGWWYEGAGIYRNVFLYIAEPIYFKHNKTVVKSNTDGRVEASTVIVNDTDTVFEDEVRWNITDGDAVVAEASTVVKIPPYSEVTVCADLTVPSPKLWDIDSPNLYTLCVEAMDKTEVTFGIRSAVFDPDRGFFLNGRPVNIHGACVHQDFGGVGVALPDNLQYYKIKRLKEMGCNAYRSAHHAPSPTILRACDELGMMVMDETRTFGTSPEAIEQLTALVERDRNHPSVIIWTIGNEEFSVQNIEWSKRLAEKVSRILKDLDDTRAITYGGNNGINDVGANVGVEVRGINYIRNTGGDPGDWIKNYHEAHPTQPLVGTEESSYVLSRGGHINDLSRGLIDCTGNVTMPWGTTPRGWVQYTEECPYFAGSFMWTGFDYRGEGNPFVYANAASSFGTIDLCGMEKPPFYYYKSWWTSEPTLKLAPHWNYKDGEMAKITVFTNCESVTLYVNGKSVGTKNPDPFEVPAWEIPFEAGVLTAKGVKYGKEITDEIRTSGKTAEIRVSDVLDGGCDGVGIIELDAYDENGVFCPLDTTAVTFELASGKIVGVGNGDPASYDYEYKPKREEIRRIFHFSDGCRMITVPDKAENRAIRRFDTLKENSPLPWLHEGERQISGYILTAGEPEIRELTTVLTDVNGYEYIEFERLGGDTDVYINGEKVGENHRRWRSDWTNTRPYRFYYNFGEGEYEIKVVSKLTNSNGYSCDPISGCVKLGRLIDDPWTVRLHYGRARIFVKDASAKDVKIVKQ